MVLVIPNYIIISGNYHVAMLLGQRTQQGCPDLWVAVKEVMDI